MKNKFNLLVLLIIIVHSCAPKGNSNENSSDVINVTSKGNAFLGKWEAVDKNKAWLIITKDGDNFKIEAQLIYDSYANKRASYGNSIAELKENKLITVGSKEGEYILSSDGKSLYSGSAQFIKIE